MANTKITSLTTISGTAIASGDKIPIVDVSDTTQAATGTTKAFDGSEIFFKAVGGTVTANTWFSGSAAVVQSFAVGTATPSATIRFQVVSATDEAIRIQHTSASGNPYFSFYQAGTRRGYVLLSNSGSALILASEYGDMVFKAASTGGSKSPTEYVRILSGGNVGIGTSVPVSKLDVAGTAQVDALRIDQIPTAGAVTLTHYVTISLNGTTYRIPCGTA